MDCLRSGGLQMSITGWTGSQVWTLVGVIVALILSLCLHRQRDLIEALTSHANLTNRNIELL